MKVHIGYTPILDGQGVPSPSELTALGEQLRVRNLKHRLRVLTGDIEPAELAQLRTCPGVKWVEVDEERYGRS